MLMTSLTFAICGIFAFTGRMLIYCAQTEAYGVPWLEYWAYGAYAFAALFAIVTVVEFFKSIARSRRRRNYKRETARTLPKRPTKQKRR